METVQFAIKRKEHSPIISAAEPKKKYEKAITIVRNIQTANSNPTKKTRPIIVNRKGSSIGETNMLHLFMKSNWQVNAEKFCLCVFLNMFHAKRMEHSQYESKEDLILDDDVAEEAFRQSLKIFTKTYMRNAEHLIQVSVTEKRIIDDFKKTHSKLHQDEWRYIVQYINCIKMTDDSPKIIQEFLNLLRNHCKPASPFSGSREAPFSLLHQSLVQADEWSLFKNEITMQDALRAYICIYYANYQELWDLKEIVLQGNLIDSIETFLISNPIIDSGILRLLMEKMDGPLIQSTTAKALISPIARQ